MDVGRQRGNDGQRSADRSAPRPSRLRSSARPTARTARPGTAARRAPPRRVDHVAREDQQVRLLGQDRLEHPFRRPNGASTRTSPRCSGISAIPLASRSKWRSEAWTKRNGRFDMIASLPANSEKLPSCRVRSGLRYLPRIGKQSHSGRRETGGFTRNRVAGGLAHRWGEIGPRATAGKVSPLHYPTHVSLGRTSSPTALAACRPAQGGSSGCWPGRWLHRGSGWGWGRALPHLWRLRARVSVSRCRARVMPT